MARTSCVRCEGEFFEVQQLKPQGHSSTGLVVQCSKCGAPVTFLDVHVKEDQSNQLDEVVNEIKRAAGDITDRLSELGQRLGAMARR